MEVARIAYRKLRERAFALRFHLAPLLGRKSLHGIAPGYRHRSDIRYFDDTENADEWQREVYHTARQIMWENGLKTVCDVGCGSGYKLVHILGEFETTGIDLPETISRVRQRYPERHWLSGSFDSLVPPDADLVICADVIEHVADPDALMRFLASSGARWIILSTPDRDLVYGGTGLCRFGPPGNLAHVREWTMQEFHAYTSRFFDVARHEITNQEQATQMIVGRPRCVVSAIRTGPEGRLALRRLASR
jgi:ubiquinone/menaquinone biosynthesis C-methylase UbiE